MMWRVRVVASSLRFLQLVQAESRDVLDAFSLGRLACACEGGGDLALHVTARQQSAIP